MLAKVPSFKSIQHLLLQEQGSSNLSEPIWLFPCPSRGSCLVGQQIGALRLLRLAAWGGCSRVSSNTSLEWTRSLASRHGRATHTSKLSEGPALRISQCSKHSRKLHSAEVQASCLPSAGWEHQGELPGKDLLLLFGVF